MATGQYLLGHRTIQSCKKLLGVFLFSSHTCLLFSNFPRSIKFNDNLFGHLTDLEREATQVKVFSNRYSVDTYVYITYANAQDNIRLLSTALQSFVVGNHWGYYSLSLSKQDCASNQLLRSITCTVYSTMVHGRYKLLKNKCKITIKKYNFATLNNWQVLHQL